MILINDLGNNISVKYEGDNTTKCLDFISYMLSINALKKHKGAEWIIPKNYLNDLNNKFETKIIKNRWDNIGANMKLTPYPYQKEAIYYTLKNPNSLLILPAGSGKTPIVIGSILEYNFSKPVIVCTKTSLKHNWIKEINKFSDLKAKVINTPSKARKKFDSQFENCDIYVLNYETLKNEEVYNKLREYEVCAIYFDEMQYINSYSADRTKAAYKFNDLEIKVGATATPITNNPLNLFSIFHMINKDVFTNITKFSKRYVIWKFRRPVGAKNEIEMLDKARPYIFRKDEEDILGQLPELNVLPPVICEMTENMSQINDIIMDNLKELDEEMKRLDKMDVGENDPRWIKAEVSLNAYQTYAQELSDDISLLDTGGPLTKDFNIKDYYNPKLEALDNIIEPLIESNNKVCIFTRYERMQNIIKNHIEKKYKTKCAYVNGSMNSEERFKQAIEKFDEGDINVIIATDAMAEGISLSHCKYLIEYEPAISYAVQTQRRGRIRRANSVSRISYVYQLITEGSWDEIQLKSINKKKGYDDNLKNL